MQYFTDLKRRTPILDVPPLIGQGTGDQAKTQPAVGVRRGTSRKRTCERLPYETLGVLVCRVIRSTLQGLKRFESLQLIRYKHGCISHISSLVNSMKLKGFGSEDGRRQSWL